MVNKLIIIFFSAVFFFTISIAQTAVAADDPRSYGNMHSRHGQSKSGDNYTKQNQPNKPPYPKVRLKKRVHGEEAIAALGSQITEVAAWHGLSSEQFKDWIRKDKALWVDEAGQLLYIDEIPSNDAPEEASTSEGSSQETPLTLPVL